MNIAPSGRASETVFVSGSPATAVDTNAAYQAWGLDVADLERDTPKSNEWRRQVEKNIPELNRAYSVHPTCLRARKLTKPEAERSLMIWSALYNSRVARGDSMHPGYGSPPGAGTRCNMHSPQRINTRNFVKKAEAK